MDKSGWTYILIAAVAAAAAVILAVLIAKLSRSRGAGNAAAATKRPGFKDVLVRDAVDISTQLYVNEKGEYFPGPDSVSRVPTFLTGVIGSTGNWNLALTDVKTGNRKSADFTSVLTIGRDPSVRGGERSLSIYEDAAVSKEHCSIRNVNNGFVISDLNSRNGTFVNGKKLQSPVNVNSGDRISIGNSEFVVEINNGAL